MRTRGSHSVGLAALSYALLLLSGDVVAKASKSSRSCTPYLIGNGHCDQSQNNEVCGYDGGDCCECTCRSTPKFACPFNDFACVDPRASCVDDVDDVGAVPDKGTRKYKGRGNNIVACANAKISDGDCDLNNNNEACDYDGGDCCECTCVSTADYSCGDESHGGFACLDPSAVCVDDDDVTTLLEIDTFPSTYSGSTTSSSCIPGFSSDAFCDQANNNENCGYDGGDCCECTCVSTEDFTCGDENNGGFACLDPSAPCVDDDDVTALPEDDTFSSYSTYQTSGYTSTLACFTGFFSDAYCDAPNNNAECGYDGGDCCECTCVSTEDFTCGDENNGGFACLDPSAPCVDDDDVAAPPQDDTFSSSPTYQTSGSTSTLACFTGYFSDGYCDSTNNNPECGYDGGDCCQCTCVSTENFTCGMEDNRGFACLDPSAPCVDDDDFTALPQDDTSSTSSTLPTSAYTSTLACFTGYFSDGYCDPTNNNPECGYDGGDCCECTCVSTEAFTCGDENNEGFACLDPSAPCVDDDDVTALPQDDTYTSDSTDQTSGYTSTLACLTGYFSDGYCDSTNNNPECGYDGGDCCECTCVSSEAFTCGDENNGGFSCVDPSAPCVDDDDVTALPQDDTDTTYSSDSTSEYTSTFGCDTGFFSDGNCDPTNNRPECGYDGGDCCECTCVDTAAFTCGDAFDGGFQCLDPSAPCVDDDDDITSFEFDETSDTGSSRSLLCIFGYFSDGICDQINNNKDCGYDGGDCCECTCVTTAANTCGDDLFGGGFACVDPSAPCVDDDDVTAVPDDYSTDKGRTTSLSCIASFFADGDCDPSNNNEDCGYDGGDCCECTCVDTTLFTCGDDIHGGFRCLDPNASCVDDDDDNNDDIISLESDEQPATTSTSSSCASDDASDGVCDLTNNTEECGYDGGDCCECTCVSTADSLCGDNGGFNCIDPSALCDTSYVEAGTKTTVGVSANTYDARPGVASGGVGCGDSGCGPELTRDGISDDLESRWSCAQKLNLDGEPCQIQFVFEEPQDIMEVQVAFFKGADRPRTIQATINGEFIGDFDSSTGSTFSALGIQGPGVETMTFTTVGLDENDWISITEVRFLVEA